MKNSLSVIVAIVGGLIAGAFIGQRFAATHRESRLVEPRGNDRVSEPARRTIAAAAVEKHDLRSLQRWHLQQQSGGLEICGQIERMDSAAIRDLMTSLIAATRQPDPPDVSAILEAAARELFHREGDKAIDWANSLDPAAGRAVLLEQMIRTAAGPSPEIALPWIGRYHKEFGKGLSNEFGRAAIVGATARGAEDLIRLKELYGDGLRGCEFPSGPFADGFDFHLLVTKLPRASGIQEAIQSWAARDKDAAWSGIKENMAADGRIAVYQFGAVFSGVAIAEGDRQAARWAASKLDELPPELRDRAVSSMLEHELGQSAAYESVMAELPRESDRVALAASVVSPFGNTAAGLGALKALGSESLQVDALIGSAKVYSRAASNTDRVDSKAILDFFTATMDQLKLSPASRETVNTVLHTPQDPYPN